MCIVCNMTDQEGIWEAMKFLNSFGSTQREMKATAEQMLKIRDLMTDQKKRKAYDRTYKQMRRLMRAWNKIEHTREAK